MFVASLFAVEPVKGALTESVASGGIGGDTYHFGHRISDVLLNLFAMEMAGIFIVSTCTIGSRSAIIRWWVTLIGYACTAVLMIVIANWKWITLVFPIWILLVSAQILPTEFRTRHSFEKR